MRTRFLFSVLLFSNLLMAQNIVDGLRYSQKNLNGTARYNSMSGAFLSLGGDVSAMTENPAASSVFLQNQFVATLKNQWTSNSVNFHNRTATHKGSDMDLGQLGLVFLIANSSDEVWALGYNYQKDLSFYEDNISFTAQNTQSVIDYFGSYAQGYASSNLELATGESITDAYSDIGENGGFKMQQAFLGYQAGLIKETSLGSYQPNASILQEGATQKYFLKQAGYAGRHTINLSVKYNKKLSVGMNVNIHSLDYSGVQKLNESGYDSNSPVKSVSFSNTLKTYHERAFSIQLGLIAKLTNSIRVAASYHSPIWFRLIDETTQSLQSQVEDRSYVLSPRVTNVFSYSLKTPFEFRLGGSYIFNKKGLLSLEYGLKNYASMMFSSDSDDFQKVNEDIYNRLGYSHSVRLGGELRVSDRLSLRAGYRFEQSPYKDGQPKIIGNLNGGSLGMGYRFSDFIMDISYDMSSVKNLHQIYERGLTSPFQIKHINHNVLLTISIL